MSASDQVAAAKKKATVSTSAQVAVAKKTYPPATRQPLRRRNDYGDTNTRGGQTKARRKLKHRQAQHKQGATLTNGGQQRSLQGGHDVHRRQQRLEGTRTFALEPAPTTHVTN